MMWRAALVGVFGLGMGAGAAWADIPPPGGERPRPVVPAKVVVEEVKVPERPREAEMAAPLRRVVGELLEGGHKVCRANGEVTWHARYPMVGFTPLEVADGGEARLYRGRVVVAEGELTGASDVERPADLPEDEGECPIMQMRSDWVEAVGGVRMLRDGMGGRGVFRATRLRVWDGLVVTARGGEIAARVTNTFADETLADVDLIVHYEGCYGKPGTQARAASAARLSPGDTLEHRFPLVVRGEGRRGEASFVASSVQVRARPGATAFDLDVGLSRWGIEARCPDD